MEILGILTTPSHLMHKENVAKCSNALALESCSTGWHTFVYFTVKATGVNPQVVSIHRGGGGGGWDGPFIEQYCTPPPPPPDE